MRDWRDAGLERQRTGGTQDRKDEGLEGRRTGKTKDPRDAGQVECAGQEGCRTFA